jgi:hypothetical protein
MALSIEITRKAFKLEIDLGETQVEDEDLGAVVNGTLSFMESKACSDEDLHDGVEIADQINKTADVTIERNNVGWKVGKDYARWGDELFKDPSKREELLSILTPIIGSAVEHGGNLLKQALTAILCNKYSIISEIRIEQIASIFMLCWNLFKTAVIAYTIPKAFLALGRILKYIIVFLKNKGFFAKIKEMGGWQSLHALVASSYRQPFSSAIKYATVGILAAALGGTMVYWYLKQ